jgi:hypothetical protein
MMRVTPFKPCCKKAAIQAFLQNNSYLIASHACGTCFSITHDFQHFIQQIFASHNMNPGHPHTFDIAPFNGQISFILP